MARGRSERKTGHRFSSSYLRRCGLAVAAPLLCLAGFVAPGSADDGPVKATLAATVNDGYARLVFDMSEYDDASGTASLANSSMLIITFTRPIDIVSVERLGVAPDLRIMSAWRGAIPTARAIRVGLSRGRGQGQRHVGGRQIFHRSVADVMERAAAQPADRGHCRSSRAALREAGSS